MVPARFELATLALWEQHSTTELKDQLWSGQDSNLYFHPFIVYTASCVTIHHLTILKINLLIVTYARLSYNPIYPSETFVPIFTLLIAYVLFQLLG